ncbi:MBL fold metallo-hydrolase [Streptomyces castrisilvae]|uniref:MBL fold metallo-hydrolase n=1 Tax=Streptomyces castrisilvae TaxID=3033811 RepID=A0ABY9HLV3_9ACTN|nr:MBL fold metallo-hydrolase [Streptomyces sp. Mut1]WLQ35485.1 MBL fold metallo-hydrolase [Streptomyces sp. Mut1]
MQITRVQHTCFVFETAAGRLAVDPALDYFGNLWSPRGRNRLASGLLSDVDAIVITHSHCDHFHPPTLLHFDRNIPVVIPARDRRSAYPMADELAEHGFRNVIELKADESVSLAGLRITSISAPDSIEGIAQQSLLISDGKNRILHGADTLEDFGTFERLSAEGPIRLALLPLNCSLNYENLRNQMSPGTWLEAAGILRPQAMVPLGINEGQRRGVSAVDAPWFPHNEALFRDRNLTAGLPDGTHLIPLDDGQSFVLDDAPLGPGTAITDHREGTGTGAAEVETALGRLWSLLLDIHIRDRHYFGLVRTMSHEAWRDAWSECRARIEELMPDGDTVLSDAIAAVPDGRLTAPVLRWFPTTTRYLVSEGAETGRIVLDSLWLLGDAMTETDYAQALYTWLAAQVRSDATALWRCRLEYSGRLQQLHARKRAALPHGFDSAGTKEWTGRQIAADVRSARHVHPRFHPAFGPFDTAAGPGDDSPSAPLALHRLTRDQGRLRSAVLVLKDTDALLGRAIDRANGSLTIDQLCDRHGLRRADYERFYARLMDFAPYCIEHHWYPSQAMAWRPDYRA